MSWRTLYLSCPVCPDGEVAVSYSVGAGPGRRELVADMVGQSCDCELERGYQDHLAERVAEALEWAREEAR